MKRVLVAGATGQLGREVAYEFERRGYWVRALVRDRAKLGPLEERVDDVVVADVTRPETLASACEGIEIVFSSVGASLALGLQPAAPSFIEIDYEGNRNLLRQAQEKGIRHFIYVSVFGSKRYPKLAYVQAHEDFARELAGSGLGYTIIRPTGFFSVHAEILKMAQRYPVAVVGAGNCRTNPIHESDLARVCVDALEHGVREVEVGGPEIHTRREIAETAFRALGREPRLISIPSWLLRAAVPLIRPFDERLCDLFAFLLEVSLMDVVAPPAGSHRLEPYFRRLLEAEGQKTAEK